MLGQYQCVPAEYQAYPGRRHAGNPLVEALPIRQHSLKDVQASVGSLPLPPTIAERQLSPEIRFTELYGLRDCVYPRQEYMRIAPMVIGGLRETYFGRNPSTTDDSRRRHFIARLNCEVDPQLPPNWKSHAEGMALFGLSGSGKTTFLNRMLLPFQVVIEHAEYQGKALALRQVCVIRLIIPHDGTVKSLCLQFFERVDAALGTDFYLRQARALRHIAQMALLITKVATSISLGLLVIDELQNLRAARGPQVEQVLNLFVQIMEMAGVSLLIVGTPSVQRIMAPNLRNVRKLTSGFESHLGIMARDSTELNAFMEALWPHQWTQNYAALDKSIRDAWFAAGAGLPAFMVLAFMLAQRVEIGGREFLDADSFALASRRHMKSVQGAIDALKSGRAKDLALYDDLMFQEPPELLCKALSWNLSGERTHNDEEPEFEEVQLKQSHRGTRRKKNLPRGSGYESSTIEEDIPVENPLTPSA